MKTNKFRKIVVLIIGLLIINTGIKAQISWYVELLHPGKTRVYVKSNTSCVEQVTFSLSLMNGSKSITQNFSFTDTKNKSLLHNRMYVKDYNIDSMYTKVVGTGLKGMSYECGGKADDFGKEISGGQSKSTRPPNEDFIHLNEKETSTRPIRKPTSAQTANLATVTVPTISQNNTPNKKYNDLLEWLKMNISNKIEVEVLYVQQADDHGQGYFSAWGKAMLKFGKNKEGNLLLNIDSQLFMLFSDRKTNIQANETCYTNQPFSAEHCDNFVVTLDITNNAIISKSIRWNSETIYSNVIRTGNIIYGQNERSMIILNLLKKTDTGDQ